MSQRWEQYVEHWKSAFGCRTLPGLPEDELTYVSLGGKAMPGPMRELYAISNGLRIDGFVLLPVERPDDPKHTWDSLQRANDPAKSRFLGWDRGLLGKFIVIADIGGGGCAAIAKGDGTIWFEDDVGFHQTTLSLEEFIERALRDARS